MSFSTLKPGFVLDPKTTKETIASVEALFHALVAALNSRDFTSETWYNILAPAFRFETDDLRRWGFTKGWTREQMKSGVSEAASKFPDWELKVLQMDSSVDPNGQVATVVANCYSTLGGYSRRSVMTMECAKLEETWMARRLNILTGIDMGAMEAGFLF